MGTVRGGSVICDSCGGVCTHLYGMVVQVRKNMLENQRVKEEYEKIEAEFGQRDFIFCYRCTIIAFGAKTSAQKRAEHAREAIGQKGGTNGGQEEGQNVHEKETQKV